MEDLLKEDFVETMIANYGLSKSKADKLWLQVGEKYLSDVYDDMSDRIQEISQNYEFKK